MLRLAAAVALLAAAAPAATQTYRPDFDPSRLKGPHAGPPNAVIVLGSPHLSQLPAAFVPNSASPLVGALARWRPQVIGVEALSGAQCDTLRRYPQRYADTVKTYCPDTSAAAAATGLDVPAATAEADRLLAAWPAAPSPAQRRRLAAVFLAGGERASAEVQWLRLPPGERHAGDGLDAALAAQLDKLTTRRNEIDSVAAPLAARLGLERLYAIDDHTADTPDPMDPKAYGAAIEKAWRNSANDRRRRADAALIAPLGRPGALMAMYRAYNAPGQGRLVFESDFGAALEEPSPQRYGRGYVAYWETRNLRMASNIRAGLGERPGLRMLVIVGASHKGYLEAYLNQMHDIRLEDAEAVLR